MSQENVELVRSGLPRSGADLIALFNDRGAEADVAHGLDGLRAGWLDWLAPWASYRAEIEELIDLGDRVVSVICDYARREPDAPEVALNSAVVSTVREARIVRAEFYTGGRDEALKAAGLTE